MRKIKAIWSSSCNDPENSCILMVHIIGKLQCTSRMVCWDGNSGQLCPVLSVVHGLQASDVILPLEDEVGGRAGHLVERLPAYWTGSVDTEVGRYAGLQHHTFIIFFQIIKQKETKKQKKPCGPLSIQYFLQVQETLNIMTLSVRAYAVKAGQW